ncbi:MAG: glycosyltransferase [Pirellulales bacterium]
MYLQLISIHGLVRADAIEMGRDADTGGQVRYVLELARHLASLDEVQRVDLITRKLVGSGLDGEPLHEAYSRDMEVISEKCHLVRIPFADCRYMRKEEIWPWLDEEVERLLEYTRSSTLRPAVVHGHYADAGYIARHVARQCDCPFVFTAHSLGRPKLAYLLTEGWSREQADRVLNMERRIAEEEECVQAAGAIIVSTNHESDTQYAEYAVPHKAPIHVIPPGTDLTKFFPYYDYDLPSANIDERYKQARNRIQRRLKRDFWQSRTSRWYSQSVDQIDARTFKPC